MHCNRFTKCLQAIPLLFVLASCGDTQKPADNPQKSPSTSPAIAIAPPEVPKFERIRYSAVNGTTVIELISPHDLEYKKGDKIFLCQYTRESGQLRIVVEAAGSKTVDYFNEGPEGLTSAEGARLYLPPALELAIQHAREDDAKRQELNSAKSEAAKRQKQLELELAKVTDEKRHRELELEQVRMAEEKHRREQQEHDQARLADEKRRHEAETAFVRSEFLDIDRKFSLILISPNQLEYRNGPKTYARQYTRDQRGLHVVVESAAGKTSEIFTEVPEGWRAENGVVFYRPELIETAFARRKADELLHQKQETEAVLAARRALDEKLERERNAFVKTEFRTLDRGSYLKLASPTEIEYRRGERTLLCTYTREPKRLRVIVETHGTRTVEYFYETADGLCDEDGSIYYHPAKLDAAIARAQAEYLKLQDGILRRNFAFAQRIMDKAEAVGGAFVAGQAEALDEKIAFALFKNDKGVYNIVFNRAMRERRGVKRDRISMVEGPEHLTIAKIDTGRKLDDNLIGYCFVNGTEPAVYVRKIVKSKENDQAHALGQIVVLVRAETDDIFRAALKVVKNLPWNPMLPPVDDGKPAPDRGVPKP